MTALAEQTGAVNLGQGFPDEDGPAAVIDAAVAALRAGHNQYAPLPGVPALREAVADHQLRRYGIELDPDTPGAGHLRRHRGARLGAARAGRARRRGRVARPLLRLLRRRRRAGGRRAAARSCSSRRTGAWTPRRVARGDRAAHARAAAQLARTTPPGACSTPSELELLAEACREHDVIALTDEVYEHLVYDGEHIPLATLPGMAERTITVSSLGKTLLGHRLEDRLGERPGGAGRAPCAASSSSSPSPAARRSSTRRPRRSTRARRAAGRSRPRWRVKRDRLAAGLRGGGLRRAPHRRHLLPQRRRARRSAERRRWRCASGCRSRRAWSRSRCRRSPPTRAADALARALRLLQERRGAGRRGGAAGRVEGPGHVANTRLAAPFRKRPALTTHTVVKAGRFEDGPPRAALIAS